MLITQPPTSQLVNHLSFSFGQEPRLPIEFLLGRVQDPVAGTVHEWVHEHQTRSKIAFEGTKERLKVSAGRRKANHDQHVREAPLMEGQLVLIRNLGSKGHQKI